MIFYPSRRNIQTVRRLSSPRPLSSDPGDATHITWMLKSFVMGITLLGLSYWLVQIAGVQYLATLTSATLLAFLLAYLVWCLLHKNRISRQTSSSPSRIEAGNNSTLGATTEALTPTPPPPFDHHQAYKFNTPLPPRDSSPPPTYEEAVRAMLAMTTTIHPSFAPAFTPPSPSSPHSMTFSPTVLSEQSMSALTESERSLPALNHQPHLALTQSQQSLSAFSQQMLPSALMQHSSSALMQESTSALSPQSITSSVSNSEALKTSALALSPEQNSLYSGNEGSNVRFSPATIPPRFASHSTRTRQQTPPPQPPKSTSVYEIGDVS